RARDPGRGLVFFRHFTNDSERKSLQPVGVTRLEVMPDSYCFNGMRQPPVIPVEFKIGQIVIDFVQMAARWRIPTMAVDNENAPKAMTICGADNIFHSCDQGADAQTQCAGVGEKIWR